MSGAMNRQENMNKAPSQSWVDQGPPEMDNFDLYVLTCTECYHAFPPRYFLGQIREFRMCDVCKKNNPEISTYLEKYIYLPQRKNSWRPFQKRLEKLAHKCEQLKFELAAYKREYCQGSATPSSEDDQVDTDTEELLQALIRKCETFETEVESCQLDMSESDDIASIDV